jgi:predicted permease
MNWFKRFFTTVRPGRLDSDIHEELRFHMEERVDENIAAGMPEEEARREARVRFGNTTLVKESARESNILVGLETALQDVRYALRGLRRSPGFAATAIVSLGLGIGANTAIFSFVNAILLKKLPVPEPSRLVELAEYQDGKLTSTVFSLPFLTDLDKGNRVFDGVMGRFPVRVSMTSDGSADPLAGEVVTGNYFRTLGVKAAMGRLLTDADIDAAEGDPVCVISYAMWRERFGGDAGIVGRKVMLNAHPYTIIGVTERGFYGPQLHSRVDMQLPVSRMGDFMGGFFASGPGGAMWKSRDFTWLEPLARLKPGVSMAQAQASIQSVARSIKLGGESQKQGDYVLADGIQGVRADSSFVKPVAVLMGIVALVLLIACANLAGLLLARANARAKEFAVRLSLGASRWRVVRQLMVESVSIACCGGAVGLLLAFWIIETLLRYLNTGQAGGSGLRIGGDPLVIGFAITLSLLTAVLFGLVPAWQAARPDVVPELKGSAQRARGSGGVGMRRFLIVFQIALSVTILFAAGLMTRTLSSLKTIDLGFDPARVITLHLDPAMNGHRPEEADRIFDEILGRLRAQPGISAASLAVVSPLEGGMISLHFDVPGHVEKSSDVQTNFNMVSPDYFKTLNQGMLAGRDFSERDVKKAQGVAIVNQRFVDQFMPGENPIGRHFKIGNSDVEIAGLVRNSLYQDLREKPWPLVYMPVKQTQSSGYTMLVRTKMDAQRAIADIRQTVRSVDPRVPIFEVRELRDQIDQGISSERVLSFLSTLFSGLATLLCGIGIYGLIAYAVSRRTREIGVRFAIGAQKSDVAKLFLRESLVLVGAGVVLGVPLALGSTRVLKSLLFGVAPGDPLTLTLTVGIFLLAGIAASVLPVLRAAGIDPVTALHYE